VSAGYGADNTNGGINGNMSKGSSKWVSEQTSLTAGGSVDIDVAEKTTLRGAVIASDTGDLTFATGSLEYSNIKDRNNSTNFGGGASAHTGNGKTGKEKTESGKGLDSASFGFSDSRQTNFATIGEGTITVRDGNTDLSKLNRDVSKAQYSTMDLGVQLSADKSTIDMLSDIEGTYDKTKRESMILYSMGEGAVKAVDTGIDSNLGVLGTLEAVGNSKKDVLTVVSIADNKALAQKIDGALEGDAARLEGAVNEVSGIVQKSDGAEEGDISHVNLYQGTETSNAMGIYAAAYDKNTNETYLNTQGTDISQGGEIINSIFTEAQRKDNTTNGLNLNDTQQRDLSYSRGNQAETLWNRFSETANTTSNVGGIYNWNNANAGSSTLIRGSEKANSLDTTLGNGVVPRSKSIDYMTTFTEYDKKGSVAVRTEQIDKKDTLRSIAEGNVEILAKKGIKSDVKTELDKLIYYNPQITDPDKIKAGDRIITDVYTNIEKTTLGKVIEYLPDAEINLYSTIAKEFLPFGGGVGLSGGFYGKIDLDKGITISTNIYPVSGFNPAAKVTFVGGLSYGDGETVIGIGAAAGKLTGELDYGKNHGAIRVGWTSANFSATVTEGKSLPYSSYVIYENKLVNGTEAVIKSNTKKYIESIQKYKLNSDNTGFNKE